MSAISSPQHVCYLVLAHENPAHVRRLVAAVEPSQVVLHCDSRTPAGVFDEMAATAGVVCSPRHRSAWASWGAAAAEVDALRTALTLAHWDHIVVLQGSEYPLRTAEGVASGLRRYAGRSVSAAEPLPRTAWGRDGGLARLRYLHRPVGRRMLRLPIPQPMPRGVALAGGAVNKVLDRDHARLVVALHDARPELARRWRHSWAPDETYVPTLLRTALRDSGRSDEWVTRSLWFTDWGTERPKSPAGLTDTHAPALLAAATAEPPTLFARKFSGPAGELLLDRVDRELRGRRAVA